MGLYMWVHFLLPMMGGKSSCNPQSRDMILQLVERLGHLWDQHNFNYSIFRL